MKYLPHMRASVFFLSIPHSNVYYSAEKVNNIGMRTILHSDLNNFYASVECQRRPELRDKPVAVVGDEEARHGIVLAKNYRAKAYGIKTGMVIWEAKQLCSDLVTVGADFFLYLKYSKKVRAVYEEYTDRIEPFGIDECWLDVTESVKLFGSGEEIANRIRCRVRETLGLTVSVGVSWNKIFAKLGSDMKKPDAVTLIDRENYKELVWPLPAEDLLYVGRATKRKLNNVNIKTIGDIAQADPRLLHAKLGKWGDYLHVFANGLDQTAVARLGAEQAVKSVGNSLTNYKDMEDNEEVKILLYLLSESVVSRCRDMGIYKVKTVQLHVRDSTLAGYIRQGQLPLPSLLTSEIAQFALHLFTESYNWHAPVRGLGVAVSGFLGNGTEQLSLMRNERKYDRAERLEKAVEHIRKQYGNTKIQRAVVLKDRKLAGTDIKGEHVIRPENFFGK